MTAIQHDVAFEPHLRGHDIWGTTLFDGDAAQRGYALNKMCFSFNDAANREAFLRDEDAYCAQVTALNDEQRDAVRRRNVLELIEAGGNVYYLAKFAGIFGLNVQDIGAQQTGMSVEEFRAQAARGRETEPWRSIVGGIGTSHVPAIGHAIARRQAERRRTGSRSSTAIRPVRAWLAAREARRRGRRLQRPRPELLPRQDADVRGRRRARVPQRRRRLGPADARRRFPGDAELSWHLIEVAGRRRSSTSTTCQEMLVDHAFTVPLQLLWPDAADWPVRTVPSA